MSSLANAIRLRPAIREDMATIAVMSAEFHGFLAAIDGSDPTFDLSACCRKLERCGFGEKPLFSCIIAEVEAEPVGYAIYSIGFWAESFEGVVLVTDLFVRDAWHGKIIGQRMVRHLAEIGRAEGCERVMWTVWRRNEAAKRFYEKLGAVPLEDELLFSLPIL